MDSIPLSAIKGGSSVAKNVKRQFPKPSELAPLLQFSLPTLRRRKRRLERA